MGSCGLLNARLKPCDGDSGRFLTFSKKAWASCRAWLGEYGLWTTLSASWIFERTASPPSPAAAPAAPFIAIVAMTEDPKGTGCWSHQTAVAVSLQGETTTRAQ